MQAAKPKPRAKVTAPTAKPSGGGAVKAPAAKASALKGMAQKARSAKAPAAKGGKRVAMPSLGSKPARAPQQQVASSAAPQRAFAPKVAMPQVGTVKKSRQLPPFLKPIAAVLGAVSSAIGGVFSRIPLPKLGRGVLLAGAGGALGVVLLALIIANSGLFAARTIRVNGTAHLEQEAAQALVEVPEGTTLLNVNEAPILESLQASPWIAGVDIQREWPNTLVVTPVEHQVKAIAYITADELAWCISEQGTWIAPLSLNVVLNAEGAEVPLNEDGSVPEGATQLAPFDAALHLAKASQALMLTDVPSDADPKSGEPVDSQVVLAGLEYAKTFSPEFMANIKDLSVASEESIAAFLTSGIEVSLGTPENIVEKERVITKLLEQQEGVTYINVREPGAYTFRSAPQTQ